MDVKTLAALMVLPLAACNTASPGFMGIEAETVTVEGSTFDVRRKDDVVELLRTSREFAPTLQSVVPQAAQAVILVTGCTPRAGTWSGEQTLMRVRVDCP